MTPEQAHDFFSAQFDQEVAAVNAVAPQNRGRVRAVLDSLLDFFPKLFATSELLALVTPLEYTFVEGDTLTSFTHSSLVNRQFSYFREGMIQYAEAYTYDAALGKITPTVAFGVSERIMFTKYTSISSE